MLLIARRATRLPGPRRARRAFSLRPGSSGTEPSVVPTEPAPGPRPAAAQAAPAPGSGGPPLPAGPLALFIASDSTVQTDANTASERDQAGWGQVLESHVVGGNITIDNRASGGRTGRFIDEGSLSWIAGSS